MYFGGIALFALTRWCDLVSITLIKQTHEDYHALDTKALALCGILADDLDEVTEASTIFRAARVITQDKGTVQRVLRLFDALAPAAPAGILEPVRHTAAGDDA